MTREEVYERLNAVFADVFDDEDLTVNDETTAADVDGWDSLMHITLIDAVEEEFDISFDMIAQRKGIDGCVITIDDPGFFHPFNPGGNRRRGQENLTGQVFQRIPCIFLQEHKKLLIDFIELFTLIGFTHCIIPLRCDFILLFT